jgi:hypothetical protein
MKKFIFFAAIIATLGSCKKEESQPEVPKNYSVKFYSSNPVASAKPYFVVVNGQNSGRVGYSAGEPDCADGRFNGFTLGVGSYTAIYMDGNTNREISRVSFTVTSISGCMFINLK